MRDEPDDQPEIAFHRQRVDEVLSALGCDEECGLAEDEVQRRLGRYGRNELAAEKPVPEWRKFLAQFTDVMVILLIAAGTVSAILWLLQPDSALPYEAIAILAIVILNGVMGYLQQSRAEKAVAALHRMSAAQAEVIRDGARQTVPAAELVPGDLMLIEEGDTIPADARVIEATALQTGR